MRMNIIGQYWHLFRWLMMPSRYLYWLFIFSMVSTAIAVFSVVVGSLLNMGNWRLVFVGIWAIVFSLWSFSALLMLHGQLLALPSNRQMRLMSGVRQRALVIHWVVLLIMAILLTVCQYFFKEMKFTLNSVVLNWSLLSLASVIFLLCLNLFSSFSLFAVWIVGMGFYTFIWPIHLTLWLLFSLALIALIGFSYWWLHWLPIQKIENIFLLHNWNSAHLPASNNWTRLPINMLAPRLKNNYTPASLYLHLLNGVTGNPASRILIWLIMSSFVILGLGLIVLLGHGGVLRDIAHIAIPITLWIFLATAGMGYFTGLFASIGRVWFYFSGTRLELFDAVEKNFMLTLIIDLFFVCVLVGLACYWVFPEYLQIKWILLYCVLVLIVNWTLLHFFWWLYCRTETSSNIFGFAVSLIIMLQAFMAGVGWSLVPNGRTSAELLALGVIFCCMSGAILLRVYAKQAIPKMSFVRRKV